ncbi:MAG: hemolysin III family protein [Anaerolineales bacterium]
MFLKLREPVNALTHLITAGVAVIGQFALLVVGWADPAKVAALLVYGVSLISLFLASGVYHAAQVKPRVLEWLRKMDHAAIYLLIAGTYTPFCVIAFDGFWRWGMLSIIWSLAVIGIAVKVFIIRAPRWLTAGVYVVMGWLSLAAIGEMLSALPAGALAWLLAGGVIYTLGALVYITKALNFWPGRFGFHEVWHIFVILGALAHFIAILGYVAPMN